MEVKAYKFMYERVNFALYILRCPKCGKELASASSPDFLPDWSICDNCTKNSIVYNGDEARTKCNEILATSQIGKITYPTHIGTSGYWQANNIWVAYDNLDGNCWIEEFKSESAAKAWAESKDKKFWAHDRLT